MSGTRATVRRLPKLPSKPNNKISNLTRNCKHWSQLRRKRKINRSQISRKVPSRSWWRNLKKIRVGLRTRCTDWQSSQDYHILKFTSGDGTRLRRSIRCSAWCLSRRSTRRNPSNQATRSSLKLLETPREESPILKTPRSPWNRGKRAKKWALERGRKHLI